MTTDNTLDVYKSFASYELDFLNINQDSNEFSLFNMARVFIESLQYNVQPLSLLNDIEGNLIELSEVFYDSTIMVSPSEIITFENKMDFLAIIGDIIGLPPFSLVSESGFILDIDKLDVDSFDQSGGIQAISVSEYARCLLARRLKFFGSATLDNIYNSIQLVSQLDEDNVTATHASGTNTLVVTLTTPNIERARLFMEYKDKFGYNLWVKPSYGIVEFNYVSI